MPTPARILNLVLMLGLLGLGGYAYWEHQLRVSTAAEVQALARERADLRRQLWARATPAAATAIAATDSEEPEPGPPAPGLEADLPDSVRNQRVGEMVNRVNRLMDSPEAQRLLALQQKAALDPRYGALFRALHLSPAQLEKFKTLLLEKQNAAMDVMAAARSQGLNPRENRAEISQLVQTTQAEVDRSIREALGATAYAQYQTYEQTLPQRNTVGQLETRLSYSTQPLTPQQSEQLIQILAVGSTAGSASPGARLGSLARATGGTPARISDTAVAQAQSVLSAAQLQALQQLQQEQQAQAQLAQLLRRRLPVPAAAASPPAATTPAAPIPPKG